MYGSPTGSISGVLHMAARRPFIAAVVVAAAVTVVALKPTPTPPPPTAPVPTAIVKTVAEPTTPAPQPSDLGNCVFKTGRVDNVCKATLDNAVISFEAAPGSTLVLEGVEARANAVRTYLTSGEGKQAVPASSVTVKSVEEHSGSGRNPVVTITLVPKGAKQ